MHRAHCAYPFLVPIGSLKKTVSVEVSFSSLGTCPALRSLLIFATLAGRFSPSAVRCSGTCVTHLLRSVFFHRCSVTPSIRKPLRHEGLHEQRDCLKHIEDAGRMSVSYRINFVFLQEGRSKMCREKRKKNRQSTRDKTGCRNLWWCFPNICRPIIVAQMQ